MSHQDRREPLPAGYQYGDAAYPRPYRLGDRLNKGETLTTLDERGARTRTVTRADVKPRQFARDIDGKRRKDRVRAVEASDWFKRTAELDRAAGLPPWPGWNVIEGEQD